MDLERFRKHCLSKKGVTEEFPFGEETLVYKVMGKMFCLTGIENFSSVNLKVDPEQGGGAAGAVSGGPAGVSHEQEALGDCAAGRVDPRPAFAAVGRYFIRFSRPWTHEKAAVSVKTPVISCGLWTVDCGLCL